MANEKEIEDKVCHIDNSCRDNTHTIYIASGNGTSCSKAIKDFYNCKFTLCDIATRYH